MPPEDPKSLQRPNNIAHLDVRRGRSAAQYVDRATVEESKVMPLQGKPPFPVDDGFRVGDFEIHPKRLELVRDGNTTRLEPKVMAVLALLARRVGEVVTR